MSLTRVLGIFYEHLCEHLTRGKAPKDKCIKICPFIVCSKPLPSTICQSPSLVYNDTYSLASFTILQPGGQPVYLGVEGLGQAITPLLKLGS